MMRIKFQDYQGNPIISPDEKHNIKGRFNPAVVVVNGIFYLFYRQVMTSDKLRGRIYLVKSPDGMNLTGQPQLVIYPEYDYERYGCEDPRIVKIEDKFCLTYVGNSGKYKTSNVCLATSTDLMHWEKQGPLLQVGEQGWDSGQIKAGVIVPKKVKGKYIMYFMGEERPWEGGKIGIACSDDLIHWEKQDEPVLLPRRGFLDSKAIEPGTNPIVTDNGILMIYNGWTDNTAYKPFAVLFSKEEPAKVIDRTDEPVLTPIKDWGKVFGCTGHIVAEGLVEHDGYWWLYYGAADRATCLARRKVMMR